MRAIEPRQAGRLTLDGFTIAYEDFGDPRAPALLLLPAWQIVHSRAWKMQVPYLARTYRVITYDPPGNGGGERTCDPSAFAWERVARQGIGLLDHLGVDRAGLLAYSRGCAYGIFMAATWPERVAALVLIGNIVSPTGWRRGWRSDFWQWRETYHGWEQENAHFWREHYDEWLSFFFHLVLPEPHSTKAIEDGIAWGRGTTPEILIQTVANPDHLPGIPAAEAIARVRCRVLIVHGDDDRRAPIGQSRDLAAARPDWAFVVLEGSGHLPHLREPVRVNLLIAEFLGRTVARLQG